MTEILPLTIIRVHRPNGMHVCMLHAACCMQHAHMHAAVTCPGMVCQKLPADTLQSGSTDPQTHGRILQAKAELLPKVVHRQLSRLQQRSTYSP